jgi:hypothetical protein
MKYPRPKPLRYKSGDVPLVGDIVLSVKEKRKRDRDIYLSAGNVCFVEKVVGCKLVVSKLEGSIVARGPILAFRSEEWMCDAFKLLERCDLPRKDEGAIITKMLEAKSAWWRKERAKWNLQNGVRQ